MKDETLKESLNEQSAEMLWLCRRIKWLGLTKYQLKHLRVDELEEKANKIIQDLKI